MARRGSAQRSEVGGWVGCVVGAMGGRGGVVVRC